MNTLSETELKQWILFLIKENKLNKFYTSKIWIRISKESIKLQKNECQICKKKGIYTKATTAHHIKYLRNYPELALTKSNLLAVCDCCHWDIHHKREGFVNEERW